MHNAKTVAPDTAVKNNFGWTRTSSDNRRYALRNRPELGDNPGFGSIYGVVVEMEALLMSHPFLAVGEANVAYIALNEDPRPIRPCACDYWYLSDVDLCPFLCLEGRNQSSRR